ncbi:MAG: Cna B-type domain-containing protein [Mediterraneibacter faecis]
MNSSTNTDTSSDAADSDTNSESSDQTDAGAPVTQHTTPDTSIASEEVTDLSVSDESQTTVLPLSTDSTNAMPVSEVSTQSADKPSAISPETISVTLSWGNSNEQSVTLTSGSSSEYGSVTKISENQWTYEFQSIPKYDDTKSAYTYTVTPEADGYSFSKLNDTDYDFSCVSANSSTDTAAYADEALVTQSPDSGVLDSASDNSFRYFRQSGHFQYSIY